MRRFSNCGLQSSLSGDGEVNAMFIIIHRGYLHFSFSLSLEYTVHFSRGYMTYGKVIFLIVNGICTFVFLCDGNDPPTQKLFGFSAIFK